MLFISRQQKNTQSTEIAPEFPGIDANCQYDFPKKQSVLTSLYAHALNNKHVEVGCKPAIHLRSSTLFSPRPDF